MANTSKKGVFTQFRAILFDLGSTLLYFDGNWDEVLEHANLALGQCLNFLGVDGDPKVLADEFGKRVNIYYEKRSIDLIEHTTEFVLRDMLESIGHTDPHPDLIRTALDAFYATSQSHWKVEPDAYSTLAGLKGMNYRLGLISNAGDEKDVNTLLEKTDLRRYFDRVWISAKVGVRKPHPRIFEIALDSMYVHPNEAVMVGDTLNTDILGANNVGISSIWITRRANSKVNDKYRTTVYPDDVISTLEELPSLLSNW